MSNLLFPIMTGLSIGLMDSFDKYRANGIQLINGSQFPADITIALRQQFNKDIDATIDLIAQNPPAPVVAVTPVEVPLPKLTPSQVPVFVNPATVPTTPTAPLVA